MRGPALAFALLSTGLSTGLAGVGVMGLLHLFGLLVPRISGLLCGALISSTGPVAVLGTLKQTRVPRRTETVVACESLFNDGVAFAVLAGIQDMGMVRKRTRGACWPSCCAGRWGPSATSPFVR
ncbi:cation:proton antiporter [Deinococcus hopiensis]|uniref:cation:proton antiporter domain-containing protein n=1 Tax=Deinococcus hopiensis TaxID=309885 RepID=UPI001FE36E11|nr:cation:proton antiporter [Deinococcus hopiensis]